MSWTSTDTATLVEILRATVFSRSTTNFPLSAMHLQVPTPNSTPAKDPLDPLVKLSIPDLLRPLSTLVSDFSTHYSPDPDDNSRVLYAALLPNAVVLKSDVAAISALGLSEAWS